MNKSKKPSQKTLRSSRRPNHAGTIWLQNGYWYGKVTFRGKVLRTEGYVSRTKTEAALHKLTASIAKRKACKTTLSEWADEWLAACRHKNEYNTYHNYRNAVGHVCRHIGDMKLVDITPHDLTKVYSSLISEGLKPSTVLLIAAAITALSRYAVRCQRIDTDFTAGAIKPKKGKRTYRVFTQDEAVQFVELLENERLKFPLLFMLLLGMRRGEAMAVKWEKIDLDQRTVTVDSQAVSEGGAKVVKQPKTANSTRKLAMPDLLVQKLQAVPRRSRKAYLYNFTKLYPDALSRDFKRITKSMQIEDMRLYDLRHTFASINIYSGTPVKEVAEQLGHSSDKIVNNVYVHKAINQNSMCAKVMDDFFKNRKHDNKSQSISSGGTSA